jgi:hypothetical protein
MTALSKTAAILVPATIDPSTHFRSQAQVVLPQKIQNVIFDILPDSPERC